MDEIENKIIILWNSGDFSVFDIAVRLNSSLLAVINVLYKHGQWGKPHGKLVKR